MGEADIAFIISLLFGFLVLRSKSHFMLSSASGVRFSWWKIMVWIFPNQRLASSHKCLGLWFSKSVSKYQYRSQENVGIALKDLVLTMAYKTISASTFLQWETPVPCMTTLSWFVFGCCLQSVSMEFIPASVLTSLSMFRSTSWPFQLATSH